MSRARRFIGVTLACWVALTGANLGYGQRPEGDKRQGDDRRQDREERRGDRDERRERGERRRDEGADRERREGQAPRTRRARSILGSKVSIRGDLAIGTVDDIIFSDDGYIDYLVVLNEGKYALVPWEAAKFDFDRRTAVIEITRERFREVPTFSRDRWPDVYETRYREKVYGYYGLRPRGERRIEKPIDRRER